MNLFLKFAPQFIKKQELLIFNKLLKHGKN
jgi:hypothetical protein